MRGIVEINEAEFRKVAALVYQQFGINLTEKKISLVQGRLNKVLRRKGYESFKEYFAALEQDASGIMLAELVDAISTNHTYFFREAAHFEILEQQLFDLIQSEYLNGSPAQLRIWCAGCATGEEAYTLAMLVREHFPDLAKKPNHPVILATDISTEALATAQKGVYEEARLHTVSETLRSKYFRYDGQGNYQAGEELKNLLLFRRLNFMEEQFPLKNRFHIVFCRNVMIYFDAPTKETLISKFHRHLVPGGFFFIGHSETIPRASSEFRFLAPAAYQRRD